MKVRCWYSDKKSTVDYIIPKDTSLKTLQILGIYDDHLHYKKDIQIHKQKLDKEIVLTWRICRKNGVTPDLVKHIINNYIKRPVEYNEKVIVKNNRLDIFLLVVVIIVPILSITVALLN